MDSNKTEINIEQFLNERKLFTFFGKELNSVDLSYQDAGINFDDFFKSVKWFSYRQNMKNLVNSENRIFHSDASIFL